MTTYSKGGACNMLAILIYYVQEQQEQSLIMLLLENIDFISSLRRNLVVYTVFILLKQDTTSFISAEDLISIGIQEEIQ